MSLDLNRVLASENLPSLPAVAVKVLRISQQADADPRDLIAVIKGDPALAAKVLRTANSSLLGVGRTISSVDEAVMSLGAVALRTAVLSFSLAANTSKPGPIAEHYKLLWRRSLTQAISADRLAVVHRLGAPAEFFAAGLLQDVGVLALLRTAPEEYSAVMEGEANDDRRLVTEIERARLGFTHIDVSVELCRRWKLPDTLVFAIARHHDALPELESLGNEADSAMPRALAAAALMGEQVCRPAQRLVHARLAALSSRFFGMDADSLNALTADVCARVGETADLLALDVGDYPSYEAITEAANAELARIAIESHVATLEAGARAQAAQAEVQKLQAERDQLESAAYHDKLTGVHNRRFFEQILEHEQARCSRYGDAMGLIFLDMDFFKKVNDTYGHRCGDEALRLVARVIRASVRDSDLVARYGGEEFVILALNITKTDLRELAERVRGAIEASELRWADQTIRLTASLGVTHCDSRANQNLAATALVEAADRALYDAKRSGRNRVQIAV